MPRTPVFPLAIKRAISDRFATRAPAGGRFGADGAGGRVGIGSHGGSSDGGGGGGLMIVEIGVDLEILGGGVLDEVKEGEC